jgi:hypothetical protein
MTAERARVYRGAGELSYGDLNLKLTNDHTVDEGTIKIEADATVVSNSVIDIKKDDGSTVIFSGKVQEIKAEYPLWSIRIKGLGYEMQNIHVETTFENKSPEYIVQYVVDTYCPSLTFTPGPSSGVTLPYYDAKGYVIDIVKDMMDILQWQILTDVNGNVSFEPRGYTTPGVTFTNGTDAAITAWSEDPTKLMNNIRVVGGFEKYQTTGEAKAGTNTVFSLDHKPSGAFRAVVGGVEISPSLYTVTAELKTITFASAQTNPSFDYVWDRPVVVSNQDDASIATNGEIFKELQAPWLNNTSDARRYSQNILDVYSIPLVKAKVEQPWLNWDRTVGELIILSDPIRNRNDSLVISQIKYDAASNKTSYELGPRDYIVGDWQREVQQRIKDLERRFLNIDESVYARVFKHDLSIEFSVVNTWEEASPVDSFILDHQTLGRLRPSLDYEADCSGNDHYGTWTGTGVTTGAQYETTGWRLSGGVFNGTNNIITVTDHADLQITGDISIAIAVKVASLPGAQRSLFLKDTGSNKIEVRINSTNKIELYYNNGASTTTFATLTGLTAGSWMHVLFVKSGTALTAYVNGIQDNTSTGGATIGSTAGANVIIGRSGTTYYTGSLDEIRVYNRALSSQDASDINDQLQVNEGMKLYLSMDNPRLGDRTSARTTI